MLHNPGHFRPGAWNPVITYEYPLSERIRTLLRLEDLFERMRHFLASGDSLDHHAALVAMFEVIDVAGRADLKSDLMQELERQRQVLSAYRGSPEVAQGALERVLGEADETYVALAANATRTGQHLRENEWLMSVKSRVNIPGGACEFDLPSYHFWLNRPAEARLADLNAWLAPLVPVRDGIGIVLKLLRDSGKPADLVATQGQFQQMLSGRIAQLVRLRVARDHEFVPEISANKYALMIRFMSIAADSIGGWASQRPRQADVNVPFELTYCNL